MINSLFDNITVIDHKDKHKILTLIEFGVDVLRHRQFRIRLNIACNLIL